MFITDGTPPDVAAAWTYSQSQQPPSSAGGAAACAPSPVPPASDHGGIVDGYDLVSRHCLTGSPTEATDLHWCRWFRLMGLFLVAFLHTWGGQTVMAGSKVNRSYRKGSQGGTRVYNSQDGCAHGRRTGSQLLTSGMSGVEVK